MQSLISSWDEIQNWLIDTPFGIVILGVFSIIIAQWFMAARGIFQAFTKGRRANRLEVLARRLDYFERMKERSARRFAKLNVYGFVFLAFLVMRVSSLYLNLSFVEAFLVSFIMFYAFLTFAITGLLLMYPDFFIERTNRQISELEESTGNSDYK